MQELLITHSYHKVRVEKHPNTASYHKYEYAVKKDCGRYDFLKFSHIVELKDVVPGSNQYDTIGCKVLQETRHTDKDGLYVTILSNIMVTHSDYYITGREMSRPPLQGFDDCFIIMQSKLKLKYPPNNSFVNFWGFKTGVAVLSRHPYNEYIDRMFDEYMERSDIVDGFTKMLTKSKGDGSSITIKLKISRSLWSKLICLCDDTHVTTSVGQVKRSVLLEDSVRRLDVRKQNTILTFSNVESLYPLLGTKYYYHPILAPGVVSFNPVTARYSSVSRLHPEMVFTYDTQTKDLAIKCFVNSYDYENAIRKYILEPLVAINTTSPIEDLQPRQRRIPIVYTIRAKRTRFIQKLFLQEPQVICGEQHKYLDYVKQTLYATDGLTKEGLFRCLDGFKRKEDVNEIFITNLNLNVTPLENIKNMHVFCEMLFHELENSVEMH